MDMVFSGRAATGGGAPSRSPSSLDAAAAGDDDLYAFYNSSCITILVTHTFLSHRKIYNSIVCRTVWHEIFPLIEHDVRNLSQICGSIPQIVRQHTLGVVGYIIWVLFTIHSSFQLYKNSENRSGFDKVIAISWWSTFSGTQCRTILLYSAAFLSFTLQTGTSAGW